MTTGFLSTIQHWHDHATDGLVEVVTRPDGTVALRFGGSFGFKTATFLRPLMMKHVRSGVAVSVDFSTVTWLSSAVVAVLVEARVAARRSGATLQVIGVSEAVHHALALARLDGVFGVEAPRPDVGGAPALVMAA